jgi:hypothetical protein
MIFFGVPTKSPTIGHFEAPFGGGGEGLTY